MRICKKCGTEFTTKECPPCKKIYMDKYNALNRERNNTRDRTWYEQNKIKRRAKCKVWHKNNKGYHLALINQWQKLNPEYDRIKKMTRRARSNGQRLSPHIIKTLYREQTGLCACCGLSLGQAYHLDHIMPLALGGANLDYNVQLLRAECNIKKGAMHPEDYLNLIGASEWFT